MDSDFIARMPSLLNDFKQNIVKAGEAIAKQKPGELQGATVSANMGKSYEMYADFAYIVEHDLATFRHGFSKMVQIQLNLFERFDAGVSVSRSFVTIGEVTTSINGLAAAQFELGRKLSAKIISMEDKVDTFGKFETAQAKFLHHLLHYQPEEAARYLPDMQAEMKKKKFKFMVAFVEFYTAFINKDLEALKAATDFILLRHKRGDRKNSELSMSPEGIVYFYMVGYVNLARAHGFELDPQNPLIPADMLVKVGSETPLVGPPPPTETDLGPAVPAPQKSLLSKVTGLFDRK